MDEFFEDPKNYAKARQAVCLFTVNIRKTPFSLLIVTQREMQQSKKLNVKTLSRPYIKRAHQRAHSKMCHLDMLAEQTHSV